MCSFDPTIKLNYTNDAEYRQTLRMITGMDPEKMNQIQANLGDIDERTVDELMFDIEAISKYTDFVYEETRNHPLFKAAYKIAAGFMFSTDETIGLSVLFCYDYLDLFYGCLVEFFKDKAAFSSDNWAYVRLMKKIGP